MENGSTAELARAGSENLFFKSVTRASAASRKKLFKAPSAG
jgi:hypothetical protein